jgi:hypothetical protein
MLTGKSFAAVFSAGAFDIENCFFFGHVSYQRASMR